ncbi:hypothetical protein RJ640_022330 [Escallonia rubra]|uniref:G-patch domain-containing protein n=1 Tax=Escallonia rubra TaxID=112253 RepID=A0AA88U8F6_9ASTE|nr:hypothetical protein RJ640_022330 [Escallonia rubra]
MKWVYEENSRIVQNRDRLASGMMADPKIQSMMARWGFVTGFGLGREGQGITDPLSPHRNEFRFGLGYKPTAEDWDREQAKAARVARLREKGIEEEIRIRYSRNSMYGYFVKEGEQHLCNLFPERPIIPTGWGGFEGDDTTPVVRKLICDWVVCDDEDYLAELQEKWMRHEQVEEYTHIPDLSNLSLLEEPEESEEYLDAYYEDWVLC